MNANIVYLCEDRRCKYEGKKRSQILIAHVSRASRYNLAILTDGARHISQIGQKLMGFHGEDKCRALGLKDNGLRIHLY